MTNDLKDVIYLAVAHPFYLTPTSKQTLYYYNNSNNEPVGPLSIDKLRDMFQSKQLGAHVWVIEKGGSDWKRLEDLLVSNPMKAFKKTPKPPVPSTSSTVSSNVPLPPFAAAAQKKIEPKKVEPVITSPPKQEQVPKPSIEPKQEPLYISRPIMTQMESDTVEESTQAPMSVQIVAVTSFISGFSNIFAGLTWLAAGIFFLQGSFLMSLIPASYGLVVGIYNIIFASKLISVQSASRYMARYLAVLDITSFSLLNPISCILGAINLIIGVLSPHARTYFSDKTIS